MVGLRSWYFHDYIKYNLNHNDGFFELLRNSYEVNPEVKKYIQEVKAQGFISCACSNNFETRIRELNNKCNFFEDFEVRVFSFEEGVIKPDKKIFETLVHKCAVQPEEIVYSDDSEEKLQGAKELGINAFVFEDFKQFKRQLEVLLSGSKGS